MKKFISTIAFSFIGLAVLTSCEEEYKSEELPNNQLSGEWFVQTYFTEVNPDSLALGYQKILTSNTAQADGNQILIDDLENIWPVLAKADVTGETTFAVSGSRNEYLSSGDTIVETVTINNGKVVPDGGRSASGIVVDSIYMEAQFSDFPGATIIITGHYRTGFTEDEL